MSLQAGLERAVQRRKKLFSITNAMRLVNGAGDGMDGLFIDCYNRHFCVQVLKDHWQNDLDGIRRALSAAFAVDYLIVKLRRGMDFKNEVLVPGDSMTTIEEQRFLKRSSWPRAFFFLQHTCRTESHQITSRP